MVPSARFPAALVAAAATLAAAGCCRCRDACGGSGKQGEGPAQSVVRYVKTIHLSDSAGSAAVVAPSAGGRALSFTVPGAGRNLLWNGPDDGNDMAGWANFGGEKTWIGPQAYWKAILGGPSWPPPKFFDQGDFAVTRVVAGGDGLPRSIAMESPDPVGAACPWRVEREVSLDGGILRVEARLAPRRDGETAVPRKGFALPEGDDGWHVWSVCQVPFAPRAALLLARTGQALVPDGEDDPFHEAGGDEGDGVRVFDIDASEKKAKIFFDGDAIALEYPDGALLARRVAGPDDPAEAPFPDHAQAQLFSGYHFDPVALRYLELEFTAVGTRALRVEFSFHPGLSCVEAIRLARRPQSHE